MGKANIMLNSDASFIVFSIGSAGSHKQQQCPSFVENYSNRIDILNYDPLFKTSTFEVSHKTHLYYFNQALNNINQDEIYQFIKEMIFQNKKIVVLDHRYPLLDDFILQIGKNFNNQIGNQLEIMGSYFHDIPVFKYHKNLFNLGGSQKIHQVLQEAWNLWKNYPDEIFSENHYNIFSTQKLTEWREQFKSIGILYRNLQSITSEDLFTADNLTEKKPKPIVGLSENAYEQLLQERIYSLKDPLKLAAALLKHCEMARFKVFIEQTLEHDPAFLKKTDRFHRTIAHMAVSHNVADDPTVIYFLAEKGVNFSVSDKHGFTPLDFTQWKAGLRVKEALNNCIKIPT